MRRGYVVSPDSRRGVWSEEEATFATFRARARERRRRARTDETDDERGVVRGGTDARVGAAR